MFPVERNRIKEEYEQRDKEVKEAYQDAIFGLVILIIIGCLLIGFGIFIGVHFFK